MIYAMENTANGTSDTFCSVDEGISEFDTCHQKPLSKIKHRKNFKDENRFSKLRENYKKTSMCVDGVLQ